ncbi:GAF domain-containing protein [Geodermatophilus sp. URMC 64]
MAKKVTESIAAVTYLYDPTGSPEGRLIAHPSSKSMEQGCEIRTSKLGLQSTAMPSLASIAFQRKRPQMLPHRPEIGQAPISTWLVNNADARVEIAVPVPAAPGGMFTPYAGVLVLCRDLHGQPYGNYELALLRNVALRIALLRTTLMMDRASSAIASTAQLFAVTEDANDPEDEEQSFLQWAVDRPEASVAQEAYLPTDFADTLPKLVPMVEAAGSLMGAQSATLRFMTLTEDRSRPYDEMALTKVVEWPSLSPTQSGPRQIKITEESITGWVVLHGKVCHVGNINVPADLARFHGLRGALRTPGLQTRSVLCIPIKVDQRVVGTLLFQSAHANAFAILENVGRASAAQVAILLSAIRRRQLREVLSIGSDVQSSAHELMGLADDLRKACYASEHAGSRALLQSSVDTLAEVIGALNAESAPPASQSDSLEALVRRAASRAGVSFPRLSSLGYPVHWGERASRRFYLAMYEIFRNIDHYGTISPEGFPLVIATVRTLGGRRFIDVAITHEISESLGEKARNLYRVAIADNERLHFGAYTAGAIVRSLGGEVFAKEISRDRLLTLVSIPEEI